MGGMLGVVAGMMMLVACGGGGGGGTNQNAALEARVAALEALLIDSRLIQLESDLAALASLRLTCHESDAMGPFSIANNIGGALETLKEVIFTPPSAGGVALWVECSGDVTPQAFVEQTQVQLWVISVVGSVEVVTQVSPFTLVRAQMMSDLNVPQLFRLEVEVPFRNPLPDSYKLQLRAAGTTSGWVGDAMNVVFKVVETQTDTQLEPSSPAIQ